MDPRESFLLVSRALPEPMFLVSREGVFLAANEAGSAMLAQRGACEGASLHSLVNDPPEHVRQCLRLWARNGQVTPGVLHCAGETVPSRCEGALFAQSAAGAPPLIILRYATHPQSAGSFRNLNDRLDALASEVRRRQRAEEALAESEAQFHSLAESIPNLCWIANADGWIFWYNQRWYEYTGTTPEEMEGWGWQKVHDPAMLPAVLERWRGSIGTGRPFEMVFPLRRADGVYGEFLTRVVPIRDKDGEVVRWFGTNTDVSELKRIEHDLRDSQERLRISEERLRLTQKAAKIGSWELDLTTDQYVCSPEVYEILGLDGLSAPLTRDLLLRMMYFSSDRESSSRAIRVAAMKNREFSTQFRIRRPDGSARWIAARGRPVFNQGRNLLLGVFIDVTEARQRPESKTADTALRPSAKSAPKTKRAGRKSG